MNSSPDIALGSCTKYSQAIGYEKIELIYHDRTPERQNNIAR
jgi:hypothetical protein